MSKNEKIFIFLTFPKVYLIHIKHITTRLLESLNKLISVNHLSQMFLYVQSKHLCLYLVAFG